MTAFLLSLVRALLSRLQPQPEAPVEVHADRVDVTVTRNRETRELRVITSMAHETALDVHHDLTRGDERQGSRTVVTAWEATGRFPTPAKERH